MTDFIVSNSKNTGVGSLRNAIELANENPGLDKIIIETDNINLNSEIEIGDALEIEGNGVVITQTEEEGIFVIDDYDDDNQIQVSLENLTLTGAQSQYEGGAISTWEDLTLDGVTIKDNKSYGYGGGLYAFGSNLIITNSTFEGNEVLEDPAGTRKGGAIFVESSKLTIDKSFFTQNQAKSSAIDLDGSRLNASNIEITDNTGKGVLGIASTMIVDNALVSNNKGAGFAFGNGAELVLSSSTVSNNEARFGGGIATESGISTITDSIIENNTATEAGGGFSLASNSSVDITNSVISGNSAPLGSAIETIIDSRATLKDVYVNGNTGSEQFEGDIEYEGSNVDNPFGQEPEGDIGYTSFVVEEPVTEEPVIEEPVTEEPVTEEPVTEEPVTEEPITEEPITEEPVTEEPVLSLDMTEVHRFYQSQKGFHFYTADLKESSVIQQETLSGNLNYDYEGESFAALASNTDSLTGEAIEGAEEVYRFYNSDTGAHLFTMFEAEKEYIESTLDNYTYEGVAYYAFESEQADLDTIPVYRMLNGDTGTHLFSTDTKEIGHIQDNLPNFALEGDNGVAFYVMEA